MKKYKKSTPVIKIKLPDGIMTGQDRLNTEIICQSPTACIDLIVEPVNDFLERRKTIPKPTTHFNKPTYN